MGHANNPKFEKTQQNAQSEQMLDRQRVGEEKQTRMQQGTHEPDTLG